MWLELCLQPPVSTAHRLWPAVSVSMAAAVVLSRRQSRVLEAVGAVLTAASVDSASAAATCVGVDGGSSGVGRRQWRVLEAVQHVCGALANDTSVDSVSAAAT